MTYNLLQGDVTEHLTTFGENVFDAVLCDPPYGLTDPQRIEDVLQCWQRGEDYAAKSGGFLGNDWDSFVPSPKVWKEVLRVLKPGGYILAFSGSRTQDLLTLSLRLAGFEIRDVFLWIYGGGFMKGANFARILRDRGLPEEAEQWRGYGSTVKPAYEPLILARKPTDGTNTDNLLRWNTGALNIEACTVPPIDGDESRPKRKPANVTHDGSEDVVREFAKAGLRSTGGGRKDEEGKRNYLGSAESVALSGARGGLGITGEIRYDEERGECYTLTVAHNDTGTADRFFNVLPQDSPPRFLYAGRASPSEREYGLHSTDGSRVNIHPTVKPLSVCEHFARMILPPPRTDGTPRRILVPFAGSGSEMIGAVKAGWDSVTGIEREAEYVAIAEARLAIHSRERERQGQQPARVEQREQWELDFLQIEKNNER